MKKIIATLSVLVLVLLYYTFALTEEVASRQSQIGSKDATIEDLTNWLAESRLQTMQAQMEIKKDRLISETDCAVKLQKTSEIPVKAQDDEVTEPQVVWSADYGTATRIHMRDNRQEEQASE